MKSFALGLLLLLSSSTAFSQTTGARKPTPLNNICLTPRQAQVVNDSLYRFQEVKRALASVRQTSREKTLLLAEQKKATAEALLAADQFRQAGNLQAALTASARAESNQWKLKAKRRFWVNVALSSVVVSGTALLITR
ncbi:hypothetical protein [Hymenobacter metallicola]|uniref:Uncharacterized protein n=1 Tax=Hymenobacter metallicola TaxID=2563114 RepID=A0A4Z0QI91_9BACT|nr:hypothetical protein [Hymenobacter metallicola]TGE29787.1 hypothetical protein E5K02_10110 [Hymenobacter metallicola]